MIRRLILGNFKAIRGPVEIDLRPVTLLFGPNASGKSSILHAIHYAIEILEGRSLDAYHTRLGRPHLNLGGFKNLIHNHDLNSQITMGFEQVWDETTGVPHLPYYYFKGPQDKSLYDFNPNIRSHRIVWNIGIVNGRLEVTECHIDLNDEPIATLKSWSDDEDRHIESSLNINHPLFDDPSIFGDKSEPENEQDCKTWGSIRALVEAGYGDSTEDDDGWASILFSFASEDLDKGIVSQLQAMEDPKNDFNSPEHFVLPLSDYSVKIYAESEAKKTLRDILFSLLILPMYPLEQELKGTLHVGPLRAMPPREFSFIRKPEKHVDNWYDGSATWNLPEKLGAGHMLRGLLSNVNWFLDDTDTGLKLELSKRRSFEDNRDDVAWATKYNESDEIEFEYDKYDVPTLSHFVEMLGHDDAKLKAMSKRDLVKLLQKIRRVTETLPAERILVLRDIRRNMSLAFQDVGTGISQVIPVLMGNFMSPTSFPIFIVEQPELHLNPKGQVALGDAFIVGSKDSFSTGVRSFSLIETHSEHILLRMLRRVRETSAGKYEDGKGFQLTPDQLAVIYVEPSPDGALVRRLRVNEQGDFVDRWPKGFFAEREEELLS